VIIMTNTDKWEKVEMAPTWDFEESSEMIGTFIITEDKVGPNESKMHTFDVEGSIFGVWGNTVLDDRLKQVQPGDKAKIVYVGLEKSEKSGREYKNFEVYRSKKIGKSDES